MNLFRVSDKIVFNILKNIEFGYLEIMNHNGKLFKFGDQNHYLKANLKIKIQILLLILLKEEVLDLQSLI